MALSVDEPAASAELIERLQEEGTPLGFALVCDPSRDAVRALGTYDARHDMGLPAILVWDQAGRLCWQYHGETVWDRPTEDALLEALRAIPAEQG